MDSSVPEWVWSTQIYHDLNQMDLIYLRRKQSADQSSWGFLHWLLAEEVTNWNVWIWPDRLRDFDAEPYYKSLSKTTGKTSGKRISLLVVICNLHSDSYFPSGNSDLFRANLVGVYERVLILLIGPASCSVTSIGPLLSEKESISLWLTSWKIL